MSLWAVTAGVAGGTGWHGFLRWSSTVKLLVRFLSGTSLAHHLQPWASLVDSFAVL